MIASFYPVAGLLVLIIIAGVWINRAGKPYHGVLFNIHKLVALMAVVLTALRLFRLDPFGTFPSLVLILLGLAVLGVIALFATGAVMSIQTEVKPVFQWMHGISLVLSAGAFIFALFLVQLS